MIDSIITSAQRIGYADAVLDVFKVIKELEIDIDQRIKIQEVMISKQLFYNLPQKSNAYDELKATINEIQP